MPTGISQTSCDLQTLVALWPVVARVAQGPARLCPFCNDQGHSYLRHPFTRLTPGSPPFPFFLFIPVNPAQTLLVQISTPVLSCPIVTARVFGFRTLLIGLVLDWLAVSQIYCTISIASPPPCYRYQFCHFSPPPAPNVTVTESRYHQFVTYFKA